MLNWRLLFVLVLAGGTAVAECPGCQDGDAGQKLAPTDPVQVILLNTRGLRELDLGRPESAEQLFREGLRILEEAGGAASTRLALMINLGHAVTKQGRLADAERIYQQAIDFGERQCGSSEPQLAIAFQNFGQIRKLQGRYVEAETLLRRGLDLVEAGGGADSPQLAAILNNLGQLELASGKRDGVKKLERAAEIWKAVNGDSHPTYARALTNIGASYMKRKKYKQAEPLFRSALAIDKQAYGEQHRRVAEDLNNLAVLLEATKRADEAESLLKEAVAINQADPNGTIDLARTLGNLGLLYHHRHQTELAERCYARMMELAAHATPVDEVALTPVLEAYASLLKKGLQPAEAERAATLAMRFRVRQAVRADQY